jgi:transposase
MGLDVGDKYTTICLVDAAGEVAEEGRLRTTREAFSDRFQHLAPMRLVLEVGTHSPWISRLLEGFGHEVIVANARRVRMIWAADDKSDEVDAEGLARLGRSDPALLRPIHHRGEQASADRAVLRSRTALVGARTALINHARGVVKSLGARLPRCSTEAFARRVASHIPQALQPALTPILETIQSLTDRIRAYDREIERLCSERYPETELLRQPQGVGPVTALNFLLTLEDPQRFSQSRAVGSYLGLRPKRKQSGTRDPELGITHRGDREMRRLLVQSSHYILSHRGQDSDLRRFGLRLAARGGKAAKKRAIVAVARKLAVLLHRLWVSGEVYDPLYNAKRRGEVVEEGLTG